MKTKSRHPRKSKQTRSKSRTVNKRNKRNKRSMRNTKKRNGGGIFTNSTSVFKALSRSSDIKKFINDRQFCSSRIFGMVDNVATTTRNILPGEKLEYGHCQTGKSVICALITLWYSSSPIDIIVLPDGVKDPRSNISPRPSDLPRLFCGEKKVLETSVVGSLALFAAMRGNITKINTKYSDYNIKYNISTTKGTPVYKEYNLSKILYFPKKNQTTEDVLHKYLDTYVYIFTSVSFDQNNPLSLDNPKILDNPEILDNPLSLDNPVLVVRLYHDIGITGTTSILSGKLFYDYSVYNANKLLPEKSIEIQDKDKISFEIEDKISFEIADENDIIYHLYAKNIENKEEHIENKEEHIENKEELYRKSIGELDKLYTYNITQIKKLYIEKMKDPPNKLYNRKAVIKKGIQYSVNIKNMEEQHRANIEKLCIANIVKLHKDNIGTEIISKIPSHITPEWFGGYQLYTPLVSQNFYSNLKITKA